MSLAFQHLFTNSASRLVALHFTTANKIRKVYAFPITSCHVTHPSSSSFTLRSKPLHRKMLDFALYAYQSDDGVIQFRRNSDTGFDFDHFLSVSEFLCNFSSAVISICYAVNCTVSGLKNTVLGVLGSNRVFVLGLVVLTCGVMIGSWIRRRQWRRICRETSRGRESVNLVERIEKLENDLRSSATIIRVLSRQLEKLGTRFRVTRKTLKDPIAEIAALAQTNSEATRALAVQEDILEKELGEIQKVLLAMQDQQQKQLELILAIGKTGKLFETKREANQEQDLTRTSDLTEGAKELETRETQASITSKRTRNDRPESLQSDKY